MTIQRQALFWAVFLVALVLFLYVLRDVLLPFAAGMILAYLLDPVVDRFEKWRIGRLFGTIFVLGIAIIAFIVALVLAFPLLANQMIAFIDRLPSYTLRLQSLLVEHSGPLLDRLGAPHDFKDVQSSLGNVLAQGADWLGKLLTSLWNGGQAVLNVFSLLVLTPVVAFYLILDYDRMVRTIDSWVPLRHKAVVRRLAAEMDASIAGYIRGQAAICLILGSYYAAALSLAGLSFGFLIGLIAGLVSFIPYVGSLTGLVLSVGVAIAQFWPDWAMVAIIVGIFVSGQVIEGNVLQPRLLGTSIGLHPVWLMFALLAFGSLFGFIGVVLAVPAAAVIGVLVRFGLECYLKSSLFHGEIRALPALGEEERKG